MSPALNDRAKMLAQARQFFADRSIMEVDCAALSPYASIDRHIDLIEAHVCGERMFFHSSPEYAMKRLLASGSGDIYQLGHVFRDGERGSRHRPEFTLAEWYRLGFTFQQMIDETVEFVHLFTGDQKVVQMTYSQLFAPHGGVPSKPEKQHLLLATVIEPALDPKITHVVTHFPADQAALARVDGEYALRFEVFAGGYELANGYDELRDADEHRRRFTAADKPHLPVDEEFLSSLQELSPCCGVAVGFDRLMMIRLNTDHIDDVTL